MKYNTTLITIILFLSITYLIYILFIKSQNKTEAFTQKEKFSVKHNGKVYDDFYSEIYDTIHEPKRHNKDALAYVLTNTQADDNSVFLDTSSKTGDLIYQLTDLDYEAYGIDKYQSMIKYSIDKYSWLKKYFKCGNASDPILFEKGIFSHILCFDKGLYSMENKNKFLTNCYYLLRPGGYLAIHIVDPEKYSKIPGSQLSPFYFERQSGNEYVIDYDGFQYKINYKYNSDNNIMETVETFTDNATGNIRQNIQDTLIEPPSKIYSMVSNAGFTIKGKYKLNDPNQWIAIFERLS
jgi:SAM-dependent methyltransferase